MLKKRIISTLLCVCLLACLSVPVFAAEINDQLNLTCSVVAPQYVSGNTSGTSPFTSTWASATVSGSSYKLGYLTGVDFSNFSAEVGLVKISSAFSGQLTASSSPSFNSSSFTWAGVSASIAPTSQDVGSGKYKIAYLFSIDLPVDAVTGQTVYFTRSSVPTASGSYTRVGSTTLSVGVNYFHSPTEAENIQSIADALVAQNQALMEYYGQVITICNQIYTCLHTHIEPDVSGIYDLTSSIAGYLLGDFSRGFLNLQTQVNYILANTNVLTSWMVTREVDPEIDGEPFGNMYEYIRSLWFAVHDPEVSGYEDPFLSSNFFSLIYIKLSDLFDAMFSGSAYTGVSFDSNAGEIVSSALSWAGSVARNLQTLAAESAENQKLSWLAEQKGVLDGVHDSFDKVGVSDVGNTVSTFHDAADTFDTGYGFSDFGDVFDSSDTSLFMWFTQDVKDSLSYGGGSG